MKKSTLFLSAMLLATAATAEIKPYVGGGFGYMVAPDYHGAENGLGMTLKGGATGFIAQMPGVGGQVELNKSLTGLNDADVLTFAGYLTYDIEIPGAPVALRPRFGLILPNAGDEIHSYDLTFSSGFGGVFRINKQLSAYADYTVLGEMITNYSAGIEFHF